MMAIRQCAFLAKRALAIVFSGDTYIRETCFEAQGPSVATRGDGRVKFGLGCKFGGVSATVAVSAAIGPASDAAAFATPNPCGPSDATDAATASRSKTSDASRMFVLHSRSR
jgi:hypothetical protein